MFSKLYKHSSVRNILVITLSNIGDAVLTAPVIDILLRDFPSAQLSVVAGAKAAPLFEGNPRISRIHVFDKQRNALTQAQWTLGLRAYRYDAVVDLRNSMIGYFLLAKWMTPPDLSVYKTLHLRQRHLNRLRSLYDFGPGEAPMLAMVPSKEDELFVDQLLRPFLKGGAPFVIVGASAGDSAKTWPDKEFVHLNKAIISKYAFKIVMVGSRQDRQTIESIGNQVGEEVLNLAGRTSLTQLIALFKRTKMAVVHDSGPMHIASYVNKPLVALFGPTDPDYYGPWSYVYKVVRRNGRCPRCLDPKTPLTHNCMSAITQQDVLESFKEVYEQIR